METEARGETRPRRRRGYFLPGAIALTVLLLIGLAVGAGDLVHSAPRTLSGTEVAEQISLGIQSEQNASTPPHVTCPASEPVRDGLVFTCTETSTSGGAARSVRVTEVDSRGRLSWTLGS